MEVVYYGVRDFVSDTVKAELAKCEKAKLLVLEVRGLPMNFKFNRPHGTIRENHEVLFTTFASRSDADFFRLIYAHHVVCGDPEDPFNSFIVLPEDMAA